MDQHNADNCACHKHVSSTNQTLTELDFDRGIWHAAIYNDVDRVRSFIAKGKAKDRDNCDYTALHYAARNGNEEICTLLLKEGNVDVNAVTKGGVTSLHRAAMMGHLPIVKLLVDSKAQLDIQDSDGKTPLHRAAARAQLAVCEYLVAKKPELKLIKDNKDLVAYDYLPDKASDSLKHILKVETPTTEASTKSTSTTKLTEKADEELKS